MPRPLSPTHPLAHLPHPPHAPQALFDSPRVCDAEPLSYGRRGRRVPGLSAEKICPPLEPLPHVSPATSPTSAPPSGARLFRSPTDPCGDAASRPLSSLFDPPVVLAVEPACARDRRPSPAGRSASPRRVPHIDQIAAPSSATPSPTRSSAPPVLPFPGADDYLSPTKRRLQSALFFDGGSSRAASDMSESPRPQTHLGHPTCSLFPPRRHRSSSARHQRGKSPVDGRQRSLFVRAIPLV